MAAYERGAETVTLRGEISGDQGKDIHRDAVYGSK